MLYMRGLAASGTLFLPF